MPKSSSARRTPTRFSAANIASVPASSLRKTLSVISSSSREGSTPAVASALVTIAGSEGLANCSGETFTATRTAFGQLARSWQAVRSAHSPIGAISPASSAIGMNLAGDIQPRVAWFQRSSASKPSIASVMVLTTG